MLHNTGPYGSNETPMNMSAPVNMTPMGGHLNMAHNINNLSKMAHQSAPTPSGHYNLPDYSSYEHPSIGIPPQMPPFPGYQQLPFSPNYIHQNTSHMSDLPWQNGMFPMNLNMQNDHTTNPMNYAYDKRLLDDVRNDSCKELPQSMRKLPLNIPQIPNISSNKPIGINNDYLHSDSYQNVNHDLGLSMKPIERLPIDSVRRKNIENTVKLIEDILIHSSNQPKEVPKHDYYKSTYDKLDRNTQKNNETVSTSSEASINTSAKKNSVTKTTKQPDATVNRKPQSPLPLVNTVTKQPELLNKINTSTTFNTDSLKNNNDNSNKTSTNSDDELQDSDNDSSSEEELDIKPTNLVDHLNLEQTHEMKVETVEIKIEKASWADSDYLEPFLKDVNGFHRDDDVGIKIIDSDISVNEANAVIKNEMKSEGCYECPHCNLLFQHPKRFLIHTKWHTFGLTYERRMEEAKVREQRRVERKEAKIQERIKSQTVTDPLTAGKTYACKDCDKVYTGKSSLKNHRQTVHPTRIRECKICHKPVLGWLQMRKHVATHTGDSGVEFTCTECPKRFKYAHSLAKHADTHLEKIHGCEQCPKKFGSQKLLKMHMKTHERVLRGTTFRCSYCGKGFYEAFSLAVHERTHRNEKPFCCEICNTSYGTNSSLRRHLKVSHSTDKPYSCSVCHRNFSTESIRDRHEQRLHGNPEDFKFPCTMCDCKYLKQKDLQKHVYKVHPKSKRKKAPEIEKSDTE